MFEIESKSFVVRIEQENLHLQCIESEDFAFPQSMGLVKSKRVPVGYAAADSVNLEHASVVSHELLRLLADEEIEELEDFFFDGISMLPNKVPNLSASTGELEQEFQFELVEAVAAHHHKVEVLESAVLSLYKKESHPQLLVRAARMVESFCSVFGTQEKHLNGDLLDYPWMMNM